MVTIRQHDLEGIGSGIHIGINFYGNFKKLLKSRILDSLILDINVTICEKVTFLVTIPP